MMNHHIGKAGGPVPGGVETAKVKDREQAGTGRPPQEGTGALSAHHRTRTQRGLLGWGVRAVAALCLAVSLVHLLMVFLHVAPPNSISQRYSRQINAWVYPLFEQNWKLFAPDPDSANRQISARTAHTDADGTMTVSTWFDLTAVDNAAVKHDPFPSHTAQNMLRRAWTTYVDTHGGDDHPHSDRAYMIQQYLRNIAVDRVAEHRKGAFESIQIRVRTLPVAAPLPDGTARPAAARPLAAETRLLPWWKVTSRGN